MADPKTTQIKVYTEEELKTFSFSRARYLAIQYEADPTKTMKLEEIIKFILAAQKRTGGKILARQTVAKPATAAVKKPAAEEDEEKGEEEEPTPTKAPAKAATKAPAKKAAPAADPDDDEEPAPPTSRKRTPIDDDEPPMDDDDEPVAKPSKKGKAPAAEPEEVEDDMPPAAEDDVEEEANMGGTNPTVSPEAGGEIAGLLTAIGHTLDEIANSVTALTERVEQMDAGLLEEVGIVREKMFIQSGLLRKILIKSGMGKEDVDKLIALYKADWEKKLAAKS
jgi:hypothetical protein